MFSRYNNNLPKQLIFRSIARSLPIALCLTGAWLSPTWAEGSKDMYPSGASGNRGHIVWQTGTAAGFQRRTLLRVFANSGEHILVGSSAVGVGAGDIEIFDPGTVTGPAANETIPSTANFACMSDRTNTNQGFIATRAEELAGPDSADGSGNLSGYEPCIYVAPTTGIYYIAMFGPSGDSSTASPHAGVEHAVNAINTGTDQNTGISAWDVTVRSSDPSSVIDIEGRLHTFFINKTMGANGNALHSDLYPVTLDGYRYEVDIRGLDPFGFRIFGNQLGNLDSDGSSPLYHDVLGTNGNIDSPVGGTSSAPPQYPLFFNQLDPAVLSFLPIYHPTSGVQTGTGFPSAPILPIADSPTFAGDVSGNTSNLGNGGTFSFNSNLTGVYEIVLSRDGVDFDPATPENRVLRGVMLATGAQSVPWNGLDNAGNDFPTGSFDYRATLHGGEYHFPISDAENNFSGGPTYTLLNATNPLGNTTAFYDHRGYRTVGGTDVNDRDTADGDPYDDALCGNNPPSPANTDLIVGTDSAAAGFNAFGLSSGGNTNTQCTGAFGDTKTIDLWTYLPSTPAAGEVVIIDPSAADYGDAPDTSAANGMGNYSTLQANNGPVHGTSADLFLGGAVTNDTDGFADGTDTNGNATDDTDDAFVSLADATANETYTLSSIPVQNSTGNTATLHAWIDFDQDGEFETGEYASATVNSGSTTADLSWAVPLDASSGTTYARFRLTTDNLSDDGATTGTDERSVGGASDGEVEDYQLNVIGNRPLGSAFTCDSTFYITIGPGGGTNQQLYSVDRTGTSFNFNTIGPATTTAGGYPNDFDYNALAYNPVDNYIYGYINNSGATSGPYGPGNVIQIGSDGIAQSLGIPVTSAPNGNTALSGNFVAGAILSDETYVIGRQGIFATLDLSTTPPTIINSQASVSGVRLNDFAVDPRDPASITNGKVFAVNENGSQDRLIVLDIRNFPPTIDSQAPNVTGFAQNAGSQFVDAFGTLFFRSGAGIDALYEVDSDPSSPTYGVATQVATTPTGGNHDGVSCLFATAMQKTVTDTDDNPITTIPAGEVVRYVYRIATGNVLDLTGVTFEDDLRSVASGPPINGTFTGDFTVSNGSGTVSFSNSNQTLQISNLTLPAQDPVMPDGEVLIITADVLVSDSLTVDTYFNQAFLTTLPAQYPASIPSDYPPSASYEDPTPLDVTAPLPTDPNVILVKRITAINRGLTGEQLFDSSYIDVGSTSDNDNEVNWPGAPIAENFGGGAGTVESYITGVSGIDDVSAVTGVTVDPGDVLEYTIPFLSNGAVPAQDVFICDRIPTNTTFDPTAFNGSTPAAPGSGDRGIFVSFNSNNVALTNDNDGDEIADTGGNDNGIGGYYFPPTVDPSVELGTTINCNGSNDNGVIVVDLSDIPNATGDGTPTNAYGFIRFRTIVN